LEEETNESQGTEVSSSHVPTLPHPKVVLDVIRDAAKAVSQFQ
jgi:hypothetical protein